MISAMARAKCVVRRIWRARPHVGRVCCCDGRERRAVLRAWSAVCWLLTRSSWGCFDCALRVVGAWSSACGSPHGACCMRVCSDESRSLGYMRIVPQEDVVRGGGVPRAASKIGDSNVCFLRERNEEAVSCCGLSACASMGGDWRSCGRVLCVSGCMGGVAWGEVSVLGCDAACRPVRLKRDHAVDMPSCW
jgi:hypothetical protein